MARNRTTFPKGSGLPATGPGYGGPATGIVSNSKRGIGGPGRPHGVLNGEGKAPRTKERLQELAPLAVEALAEILADPAHPARLGAINATLNRTGFSEKQTVEHEGVIMVATGVPRRDAT